MRSIFSVAMVAGLMLLGAAGSCLALQENMELTRQQAEQEFGLKITSKLYGTNQLQVWLEFTPKGKLEGFTRVELEITDAGKRVVSAALATTKGEGDKVTVAFGTDPAYLATSRLTIVVWQSERTRVGYQLKVKDFVNLQQPR